MNVSRDKAIVIELTDYLKDLAGNVFLGTSLTNQVVTAAVYDDTEDPAEWELSGELVHSAGTTWQFAMTADETNQAYAYGYLHITADEIEPIELEFLFYDFPEFVDGYPALAAENAFYASFASSLSVDGTVCFVVVPELYDAPTPAQIQLGTDSFSYPQPSGRVGLVADEVAVGSITGLITSRRYKFCLVIEGYNGALDTTVHEIPFEVPISETDFLAVVNSHAGGNSGGGENLLGLKDVTLGGRRSQETENQWSKNVLVAKSLNPEQYIELQQTRVALAYPEGNNSRQQY